MPDQHDSIPDFGWTMLGAMKSGEACYTWQLQTKRSTFYNKWRDLEDWVAEADTRHVDTYFGACYAPSELAAYPMNRPKADQVVAVPALWVDIDWVEAAGHKKHNLPPSPADAMRIIDAISVKPTFVVDSGGGYQCWWVFADGPFRIRDDTDRKRIATLVQRWQLMIRLIAQNIGGWDVDSTHDLARVMRLPGTWNTKYGEPRRVTVERTSTELYSVADCEVIVEKHAALPANNVVRLTPPGAPTPITANITPATTPAIPAPDWQARIAAVSGESSDFATAWNKLWHKEARARGGADDSSSAWEMAICNLLVKWSFADAEIVAACTAWRKKHGLEDASRASRPDYYPRTIAKARQATRKVGDRLAEIVDDAGEAPANSLARLSAELGLPPGRGIERVIRYNSEPPEYHIVVCGAQCRIGSSEALGSQTKLRARLLDITQKYIMLKQADWAKVVEIFVRCAEEENVGDDGQPIRILENFLSVYLSQNDPVAVKGWDDREWQEAAARSRPFTIDGQVYFSLSGMTGFEGWLAKNFGKWRWGDMPQLLKQLGWTPTGQKTIRVSHGGDAWGKQHVSLWRKENVSE